MSICSECEFFYEGTCLVYCSSIEDVTPEQCEAAYTYDEELESICV